MYEHDFFPNPTYQDMLSFISTSKKLIEDNFVLIPSAVLGKILGLESKIMKLNYNTSDKVKENRLKMRFTEYTNLLKSKYFDFRRKLYYADVSLREELNAFSTIKSAIFAIYIFAVIAGGLDAIIISITHAVTPGATLIAVMSAVIIIALIIVMDRLNK